MEIKIGLVVTGKMERAISELEDVLHLIEGVTVERVSHPHPHHHLVFLPHDESEMIHKIESHSYDTQEEAFVGSVILLTEDPVLVPEALMSGAVEDVLCLPIRPADVISKVLHYFKNAGQQAQWAELSQISRGYGQTIAKMRDDLALLERIQKRQLKNRFPHVQGLKSLARYWAGEKSGGDFLEILENQKKRKVSFVLSDSSSYGISSAFLTVLMGVAMRLSQDRFESASDVVAVLWEELQLALREEDHVSLFFGTLDRQSHELTYLHLGHSRAFFSKPGKPLRELPSTGEALHGKLSVDEISEKKRLIEKTISIEPGSRLLLVSDGVIESAGGTGSFQESLAAVDPERDLKELFNQVVYSVKRGLQSQEFPPQDASILLIEFEKMGTKLRKVVG